MSNDGSKNRSIFGVFWRNVVSRLKRHSLYHLVIPLTLGLLVEAGVHEWVPKDNFVEQFLGSLKFRYLVLILGVGVSWLLVMVLLIRHETKKNIDLSNLMLLQEYLNEASGFYAISTIALADWFNPGSQLYLAKLMKHKLEADHFEHERTLLFFSDEELTNTKVELMDETHHGQCLAFMHREFGIPLSFLERKEIFEILKKEFDERELSLLGCYPRWTNWGLFKGLRRLPLNRLRRRIPQLDFGVVTHSNGEQSVLRVRRREDALQIQNKLSEQEAKPYIKFAKKIREHVHGGDQKPLVSNYDFLVRVGSAMPPASPPYKELQQARLEKFAEQHNAQFRIQKYTRFVDITQKSGDVSVREEFDGVTAFPDGTRREMMARQFSSQFGHFLDPEISDVAGTQIGWEWEKGSKETDTLRKGFITFARPVRNDPVRFVIHRKTHNAMHFNQRDRQKSFEEVYGHIENLHELYVLKVRFPKDSFPQQFWMNVEPPKGQEDNEEEKLASSRLARFTYDSTAVLVLHKPRPGYTYRIRWDLPKDDTEERKFTRGQAQTLWKANQQLLTVSSDPVRSKNVHSYLNELQAQIAHESIGGYAINDPEIEVCIHAYDDDKHAFVMVASTGNHSENVVLPGRGTVGQAYKRRDLVSWIFASDSSNDQNFWDYGSGHLGIISIPLFFPLQTTVGSRVCVLSIATNTPGSGFLDVVDVMDVMEQLGDLTRLAPITRAFTQVVNAWYAKTLANAIGLPVLPSKKLNQHKPSLGSDKNEF